MYDRALQAMVKAALEPEWEAVFEPNSYGFRPGRSCHDAIKQIKTCIQSKAKYVLDADIAKCFDRIDHVALLQKLNTKGKVRQQIKAWLKSGVIDQGAFTVTSEGTPQGGVISPLLANIALHGLENVLRHYAGTLNIRDKRGMLLSRQNREKTLSFIRYADDFVVIHEDKAVVQRCREIISEWLSGIGLQLKPEKTRLTHTLYPGLSEDGKAGFDFLSHHIQQYPAGKYRSPKDTQGRILGYKTLITPTKEASKVHQEQVGRLIKKHRSSPQAALIKDLNPVIRGWASYYSNSDIKTVGEISKQDNLTYLKLRRWAKRRCRNSKDAHNKYWITIGGNNWVFATRKGNANPLRLLMHSETACSSNNYVKVKSDKSPFDGDTEKLGSESTFGYITSFQREELELPKSHHNDAFVIAGGTHQIRCIPLNLEQNRRNRRSLEQFYDAKYIDLRTGKKETSSTLFSGRRTRNKNLNGENLRKFRGQKTSKGKRAIRQNRYPYQQHDLVFWNGEKHCCRGMHCLGTRLILHSTGKSVKVSDVQPCKWRKGINAAL